MLGIKIKGTFLSLYDSVALTFDVVQPIGIITEAIDEIKGGYTFPIDIPIDDVNTAVVGHINRLDVDAVLMQDEYCEIWADGLLLYTGRAHIKGSTLTTAKLFMVFNEVKELSGVSLAALDLGGDRNIGADITAKAAHMLETATDPLDHDYVFCPVYNPIWGRGKYNDQILGEPHKRYQNYFFIEEGAFAITTDSVYQSPTTPFIRLDYLLKQVFAYMGYTLDNQFQTTDELKQILVYNNYSITIDGGASGFQWQDEINLINHVPYRNCTDLIKALLGTFALGLYFDHFNKSVLLVPFRDLISGPVEADWTDKASAGFEYNTDRDFYSKFRYGFDENDELSLKFSLETFPQNIVFGEGLTARQMYDDGDLGIRYAIADNTYYFIPLPPLPIKYVAQDQKPVEREGSDKTYTSELIPMWNSYEIERDGDVNEDLIFQEIMLPHIQHVGYYPGVGSGSTSYPDQKVTCNSFRLMLYRGMQPADVGIDLEYPMAGTTAYNIRGEQVGDHSLLWDRDDGVFAKWWKLPYYMLRDKKTVTRRLDLTIRDLVNFRFYHKIRIENQNYFITRLRYTLTHRGLSVTEATMITTL